MSLNADRADPDADVLDALIWHALTTNHSAFARGAGPARRYDPDVAAFAAVDDDTPAAWAALAELVGPGSSVLLSGRTASPPATWRRDWEGRGHQMVLDELAAAPTIDAEIVPLTVEDVPAMLSLVELTQPGPFRPRTIELGNYVGVKRGGELVAMAGERLQTPGYTEVSAVCTHPSARGLGLAAALSHRVASGIIARGQTPILHVATTNDNARRVYERLGFVVRGEQPFLVARAPEA